MSYPQHDKCIVCGSAELTDLKDYSETALCKCNHCSMVFSRNIPSTHELEEYYSRENYNRTAYLSPITVNRYIALLDEFEKYRKTNRILDVGAGYGFLLKIAKSKGWEVYGTELTDDAVEHCKAEGIEMRKGNLHEVGFEEGMFDVITSIEVIEHLNTPNELVGEMKRLLRPGGKAYLTTPNFNALLRYRLKSKYDVIEFPLHLCYYTKRTLGKLFKDHGFQVEKIRTTGISLTRLRTSKGKSNQDYVSETSDDEMIRYRIERNWFLRVGKGMINGILNLFKVGDSLKASFIKK